MGNEGMDLTVYNLFQAVGITVGIVAFLQIIGGVANFNMSQMLMEMVRAGVERTIAAIPEAIFSMV